MKKVDPNRPYRRTEINIAFTKRKIIMQKEALIRGGDGRALYIDCYTGKTLRGGDPYDYEHLRSAEGLYNKYKHILTDGEIAIIVNCPENVGITLRVINQSKGRRPMEEWIDSSLNNVSLCVDKVVTFKNLKIADRGILDIVDQMLKHKKHNESI